MNITTSNIAFYRRYYKLLALAVVIMVGVIVGSLVVGESVRATLVQRVHERLGNTETIVFANNSFLKSEVINSPIFEDQAQAILLTNGFISDNGMLIPVMVWGIDNNDILEGSARINLALAECITSKAELVLRLPATGLVPSGSLFVTDNYTTSARFTVSGIIDAANGGNLSLKNEQTIPYNIFVSRTELASILDIEDKVNLILCAKAVSYADFCTIWRPAMSGLDVNTHAAWMEITSDRVFIQGDAVQTLYNNHPNANRLFSYLVNSIDAKGQSIPYSFATAADQYRGRPLQDDEFILSDYAAVRIGAQVNDPIRITYYVSKDLKTLVVDTLDGVVKQIVPLSELVADKTLSANFPGLSDVEKCTDWDSDLPIDMNLITKQDEDYWASYRTTPKVIIPYRAVYEKWGNAYGNATALRIPIADTRRTASLQDEHLTPAMFGIQIIQPKQAGLNAARSGVDFSSLFLSLGFFIILSAILLMLVPLAEMIYVRRNEIALYAALGYTRQRIVGLLWRESAPVVLIASFIGIVAGLLYTWLILLLLGSLWQGATHTGGFVLFPSAATVLIGFVVGIAIALITLWISLRFKVARFKLQVKPKARNLKSATLTLRSLLWANLYANRRRALLSFFTLTAGVLIVFSVGLNRRGFADNAQLASGTGGYSLWCESSVPIYHNMSTPEGRKKLALTDLPQDARIIQMTRYGADDASCLNLNKVSQPTVLGVDMNLLQTTDFEIERHIYANKETVFTSLQTAADSVYPVLIDETVLMWGLMLQLGDTISYKSSTGKRIYLRLAGTLKNSIFQGSVLMDKTLFSTIWGEITGSEIALVKVKDTETEATRQLLSQALNEYGVRVTPTAQRLKEFNSVTDAYLNIFLTLGGLGLLLGIMCFIIVIRKDLLSRKEQISIYRSLGFTDKRIAQMLVRENRVVPLCAIVVGVVGSLAGAVSGLANVSIWIWLTTLVLTVLLILSVVIFIVKATHRSVVAGCLAGRTCRFQ
ncbi:hypothetical protein FACS189452_02640 [Bacteroidia bacterium]|nr:hypothetical protein FACS189452_02640 [Bacteroidia bacterium]